MENSTPLSFRWTIPLMSWAYMQLHLAIIIGALVLRTVNSQLEVLHLLSALFICYKGSSPLGVASPYLITCVAFLLLAVVKKVSFSQMKTVEDSCFLHALSTWSTRGWITRHSTVILNISLLSLQYFLKGVASDFWLLFIHESTPIDTGDILYPDYFSNLFIKKKHESALSETVLMQF